MLNGSDETKPAGEKLTLKLAGINYVFRWCPAGSFVMGSPGFEPGRHRDEGEVKVLIRHGFWLMETTVTQCMWESVMHSRPWHAQDYVVAGSNYPAVYINWNSAFDFCDQFSAALTNSTLNLRAILPTEAQWEYACRAGTSTAYYFGDARVYLIDFGWFEMNADAAGEEYPHEVRLKKPNSWGLFDMHGNVWEWCLDKYCSNRRDGESSFPREIDSDDHVLRGGSWAYDADNCRSAARGSLRLDDSGPGIGFRIALVKPDEVRLKRAKPRKKW